MIFDKLENIGLYSELPIDAIEFVKNLKKDIELGKYKLENDNFVSIEEYNTKSLNNAIYEAHDKYTDIQILLNGKENIYYNSVGGLDISIPYDEKKDIKFFKNKINDKKFVTLDSTNFVVLYPHEAHAPQVFFENSLKVKKVVIKIIC